MAQLPEASKPATCCLADVVVLPCVLCLPDLTQTRCSVLQTGCSYKPKTITNVNVAVIRGIPDILGMCRLHGCLLQTSPLEVGSADKSCKEKKLQVGMRENFLEYNRLVGKAEWES